MTSRDYPLLRRRIADVVRQHGAAIVIGLGVAVVTAGSAPWWWKYVSTGDRAPQGVTGFEGSCEAFRVYAQNRWAPLGAAFRAAPSVDSKQVGSAAPNKVVMVNGWVHSRTAYPTNTAPWNSDVWFHLADNSGWVSFAGVRELPTTPDEAGLSEDGGPPVPLIDDCLGATR